MYHQIIAREGALKRRVYSRPSAGADKPLDNVL